MIIELLDRDKNLIKINSIDEMPEDLSVICSIQIIDYTKEDIASLEKIKLY